MSWSNSEESWKMETWQLCCLTPSLLFMMFLTGRLVLRNVERIALWHIFIHSVWDSWSSIIPMTPQSHEWYTLLAPWSCCPSKIEEKIMSTTTALYVHSDKKILIQNVQTFSIVKEPNSKKCVIKGDNLCVTWFLGPETYVIQRKIRCLAPVLQVVQMLKQFDLRCISILTKKKTFSANDFFSGTVYTF